MRYIFLLFLAIFILSCTDNQPITKIAVGDVDSLIQKVNESSPGELIILENGVWKDVKIHLLGKGSEKAPIRIMAETPGEVFIEGESELKFGGEYVEVSGLFFRNGRTPSNNVVEFKINDDQIATHCKLENSVILNYNQLNRDRKDHWVEFWGKHNSLENCYLSGKSNEGPTVRVDIKGRKNIRNYHRIMGNHFGPRPRKGGPKGETIQLGDSYSSMSPSNTLVANNLFDRCNGEVEVISSKTNYNEFRNNVFYKSEGSMVTRHGNYCIIDGNFFIGDGESANYGGIRLINTGHWVSNNYFYGLKGKDFRAPLAVMNGIPKSPLNRYNQVTDVVVANNTWVNCEAPFQFGIGNNIDQKDVLPKSEIRSAKPIRTLVANNVIYNENGTKEIIVAHDKLNGIQFEKNYVNNQGVSFESKELLQEGKFGLEKVDDLFYTSKEIIEMEIFPGFEFDQIDKDILGNSRDSKTGPGAFSMMIESGELLPDKDQYGPKWYDEKRSNRGAVESIDIQAGSDNWVDIINNAPNGSIISFAAGNYPYSESIIVNRDLTLRSETSKNKASLIYNGPPSSPAFELHPMANLNLEGIHLKGNKENLAFSPLKENMSYLYKLKMDETEIEDFLFVIKAYKATFADSVIVKNSSIKDCSNGFEFAAETNDKGDYNVEFLIFENTQFENVDANVIDHYRGGYDESTIGGNLIVSDCSFSNCGTYEESQILIKHRGIIHVDIKGNTFKNNPVNLVAVLWGAKDNKESDNTFINSGEIKVVANLKQKLMY